VRLQVATAMLAAFALSSPPFCLPHVQPTSPSVGLELRDLYGRWQNLRNFQGRIVVLNFWAPWCEYCREKMPSLNKIKNHYRKAQIQVIGVTVDDPQMKGQPRNFKRPLTVNFPLWVGATLEDMHRFGFGDELPATAIIDSDGQIVARMVGAIDDTDFNRQIDWLLSDRNAPPPLTFVHEPVAHEHSIPSETPSHPDHNSYVEGPSNQGVASMEAASLVPSCALCPSPTVSGVTQQEDNRWTSSIRFVPGLTHSSVRFTLGYQFLPRLSGGIAVYPRHSPSANSGSTGSGSDHNHDVVFSTDGTSPTTSSGFQHTPVRPYVNFVAVTETERRPAVILGTSSDRIDLPYGQAFFATVGKSLFRENHLSIAPYVGASYGTYDDRVRPIGGLNINFTKNLSSLTIFDGVHAHLVFNVHVGQHGFSFILVDSRKPGASYTIVF